MVCPAIVDEGDHLFDRRSSFPPPSPPDRRMSSFAENSRGKIRARLA
jgi:hypothetical protein